MTKAGSYDDLADDLFGYAAIYQEHGSVVETTPKFYLASDKTDAIHLAERILTTLGYRGTKETAEWSSLQTRAFTFLMRAYDEVRAAGLFLGRRQPQIEKTFPSLYTVTRSASNNNLAMNQAVLQVAKRFVRGPDVKDGMLNRVEAVIRAFDPCLSCSTHALGKMPMEVTIMDSDGTPIRVLR